MNHKRKGPKSTRAGCLMCKPNKLQGNSTTHDLNGPRPGRAMQERRAAATEAEHLRELDP